MKVYIAGPYTTPDPFQNTCIAMKAWHQLRDLGHIPFCPHLTYYLEAIKPRAYEDWMAWDFAFLSFCDVVFRLPGASPGADREEVEANRLGIPVVHSYDELKALSAYYDD